MSDYDYWCPECTPIRCAVCETPDPAHSGLCCAHRYDEQAPCGRCEVAA